uniref:Ig-like domain-containing protein n=1 Tax=Astatotilapia calliptera TaxID=8154 RepID=A0AAX7V918_ASTCA
MLCHLVCPRSSFPLCLFLTLLTFFLTLFARCFSLCASVCLTLLLYVFHSGAVMSVHSRAQRFEVLSNGTLVIQNIQLQDRGTYICSAQITLPSDRGVYRCVASNSAGAASTSVRVHVSSLPPVIQQPREEHLLLSPGRPVYAHCSARGAPPPTLRWRIPDGTLVRPSQFLHGNLFKDAGDYLCIARNKVADDYRLLRVTVAVKVKVMMTSVPTFTDDRSYHVMKVRQGATARIPCRATGNPTPTVTWFNPANRVIPRSLGSGYYFERVVVVSNGTLEVRLAQKIDTGNYTCQAKTQRLHFFVLVYNLFECLHSVSLMPKETANPCVGDTDNSQKGHIADIQFMSH